MRSGKRDRNCNAEKQSSDPGAGSAGDPGGFCVEDVFSPFTLQIRARGKRFCEKGSDRNVFKSAGLSPAGSGKRTERVSVPACRCDLEYT